MEPYEGLLSRENQMDAEMERKFKIPRVNPAKLRTKPKLLKSNLFIPLHA